MASARVMNPRIDALDQPHRELAYRADEAATYAGETAFALGPNHPEALAAHDVALDAREELYASFPAPPATLDVLDDHGGLTIESDTLSPTVRAAARVSRFDFDERIRRARTTLARRRFAVGPTLWRPGGVLKGREPIGDLIAYDPRSFYQDNDNVTLAVYRVPGYGYPVLVWFDNRTGQRIA